MEDTIVQRFEIPEGVTLEIEDPWIERGDRNDPAFYTGDSEIVARLSNEALDREWEIRCLGEMRIAIEGIDHIIRYPDRLIRAGVNSDKDLRDLEEAGKLEWINNSWFEVIDSKDPDSWQEWIYLDIKEAIEETAKRIKEEE
jgi:hypothetical protein